MTDSVVLTDPKSIAIAGEKIYGEKYKNRYEPSCLGKFLAIDVVSGEAILADEAVDALDRVRASNPNRLFYLRKIGSPTLCRVGMWPSNALP